MLTHKQYVSPALRNRISPGQNPSPIAKKTALKKGFDLDQTAFPSLGDTLKKSANAGTPISFSAAAAKKVEVPIIKQIEVLPGWVLIRHNAGKIQYKYGEVVLTQADADRIERADQIMNRIIVKNRIAREEYDRMRDIERLGDLSEYAGQPTLEELFENEVEDVDEEEETSDYVENDYQD